jgi:Tol biopolymer transport system component
MKSHVMVLSTALSLVLLACNDGKESTPPPSDTTPPTRIANLEVVSPAGRSVTLVWTSPAHDGSSGSASRYELRRAATPLTEEGWASATIVDPSPTPKPAGAQELKELAGLPNGTWYFAIKSADEIPNWSALSNVVHATVADLVAPGRVTDLAISAASVTSLTLTWTAPGNDGNVGRAVAYDLRQAAAPITEGSWGDAVSVTGVPAPDSAGSEESFTVTGLERDKTYYFALKASDESPGWSALSNVVSGSTKSMERLTTSSGTRFGARMPAWSPDGETISFAADWASAYHDRVYTIPATGGAPVQMTNDPNDGYSPAWSPDGSKMAFISRRGGESEIWIMAASPGATPTLLAAQAEQLNGPAWSPDGTQIAYYWVSSSDTFGISTIPAGGGAPVVLISGSATYANPTWSPDNTRIAFSSDRSGNTEIWAMQVNGGDPVQLTNAPGWDTYPCWSRDGSQIAFTSDRSGNSEIWVMAADGGSPTQLTSGSARNSSPAWSPDGHRIAFVSSGSGPSDIWILYLE